MIACVEPLVDCVERGARFRSGGMNVFTMSAMHARRDHLGAGESLVTHQTILSPDGRAVLGLQADGNLVLYNATNGLALWATGTQGKGVVKAILQTDGNFVLLDAGGQPVQATGTRVSGEGPLLLQLQDDGNLVLYGARLLDDWSRVWSSETDGWRQSPSVLAGTSVFEDFASSAIGKALISALGPGIIANLLSSLPGVGMLLGQVFANPIAQNMLPGLARGERVDKAFISSVKTVTDRILSSGGIPAEAQDALNGSLRVVTDVLKANNIDPRQLDDLVSRGTAAGQELQARGAAIVGPQIAELAKKYKMPADMLGAAIDGVLRIQHFGDPSLYDDNGDIIPMADAALDPHPVETRLDYWLGTPITTASAADPGHWTGPFGYSTWVPGDVHTSGRWPSASEVYVWATQHFASDFGGALGLVTMAQIYDRLHKLAVMGKRPDETQVNVRADASAFASDLRLESFLVTAVAGKYPTIDQALSFALAHGITTSKPAIADRVHVLAKMGKRPDEAWTQTVANSAAIEKANQAAYATGGSAIEIERLRATGGTMIAQGGAMMQMNPTGGQQLVAQGQSLMNQAAALVARAGGEAAHAAALRASAPKATAKSSSSLLLYGGLAAAAAGVLFMVMRR